MAENERPPSRRQNLHLVKDKQKDAAVILMEDLIRRARADEITIMAVTEHETLLGPKISGSKVPCSNSWRCKIWLCQGSKLRSDLMRIQQSDPRTIISNWGTLGLLKWLLASAHPFTWFATRQRSIRKRPLCGPISMRSD